MQVADRQVEDMGAIFYFSFQCAMTFGLELLFLPHASNILFLALSVTFLFVPQISREPLNGFAPNSQGRRVWSLARRNLNTKAKGQRSRSTGTKNALSIPITLGNDGMERAH